MKIALLIFHWFYLLAVAVSSSGSFGSLEDHHISYSERFGEEVELDIGHTDGYEFAYVSVDIVYENHRIINFPDILDGRWIHVVISWSMDSDLNTYINGCTDNQWWSHEDGDWEPFSNTSAFYIGCQPKNELPNFHINYELNVWYEVLTNGQVWHLYLRGGIISEISQVKHFCTPERIIPEV